MRFNRFVLMKPDTMLGGGGTNEGNNSPTDPDNNNSLNGDGGAGDGGEGITRDNPPTAFTGLEAWKNELPPEIREDPSLKAINDINGLAKSYVHSQKMLGADKIQVPDKYADDTQWRSVFTKLGLPEDKKDYNLNIKSEDLDPEFLNKFKDTSYDLGILPKQAEKLIGWYNEEITSTLKSQNDSATAKMEADFAKLKEEWRDDFDRKGEMARIAVKHFGGEELQQYFNETGLGNDVNLIRLFSKIGEGLNEDSFSKEVRGNHGKTAADAQSELNAIMGNMNSPYFHKDHPQHNEVVQKVQKLYQHLDA